VAGETGEASPAGYTHGEVAARSTKDHVDYVSDLAWSRLGVEPAEQCEIAVDRELLQVIQGLLPPQPSPDE